MHHSKSHAVLLMLLGMFLCMGALAAHAAETPLPSPTQQQTKTQTQSGSGETIANPLRYDSLTTLLNAVLKAAIQIGSIVLTIALVWTGFKFVAARGNEEKIRSARTALMWTIIGGLILLGATAIQTVITSTVNSITT